LASRVFLPMPSRTEAAYIAEASQYAEAAIAAVLRGEAASIGEHTCVEAWVWAWVPLRSVQQR
jgi:hypothetical protein